jgi:hypothetical protein
MLESLLSWLLALILSVIGSIAAPIMTLGSVEQVNDYPLYVMHYYGDAEQNIAFVEHFSAPTALHAVEQQTQQPAWACSLFAAFTDPAHALYGRNFDWQYSPALLLVNHPPDGYESVAMVDIAYLGFETEDRAKEILDLPLLERAALLNAPFLPFDGMNEAGLAIGMAAVPYSPVPRDPDLPTTGSLGIIREVLDHAATVDEAIMIFGQFNIDMTGGPPLHYLIADMNGESALIEFYRGEIVVQRGTDHVDQPWNMATNFIRASVTSGKPESRCWRYAAISARLAERRGAITPEEAMALLGDVAQPSTQWSIVYGMATGAINVVMHQQYDTVYTFNFEEN